MIGDEYLPDSFLKSIIPGLESGVTPGSMMTQIKPMLEITMNKSNVKLWVAGSACAICCAIPIFALLGVGGLGAGVAMSGAAREILICLVPIALIIATYLLIKNRRRAACCVAPSEGCSSSKCGIADK